MIRGSLKARHAAATKARELAQDAVYATMHPRQDVPFYQCLTAAAPDVVDQWRAACDALDRVEREAIDKGRAWRGQAGGFYWHA